MDLFQRRTVSPSPGQPDRFGRARHAPAAVGDAGLRDHLARHADVDRAGDQALVVGRAAAGLAERLGLAAVVIAVEAADQPLAVGIGLAAEQGDRNARAAHRFVVEVQHHHFQPQVVGARQPAVAGDADAQRRRIERDRRAGRRHLAVGVVIIHLGGQLRRHGHRRQFVDGDARAAPGIQRHRLDAGAQRPGGGHVIAAVERHDPGDQRLAGEAVVRIVGQADVARGDLGAQLDRRAPDRAAGQIGQAEVDRQRRRRNLVRSGPAHRGADGRQAILVDLEAAGNVAVHRLPGLADADLVGAERGVLGDRPLADTDAVAAEREGQLPLLVVAGVANDQAWVLELGGRITQADIAGVADEMLDVHGVAGAEQRPVEHRMPDRAVAAVAGRQLEISGLDAAVPAGQREAVVAGRACADHQRMAAVSAAAIAGRLGQFVGHSRAAAGVGGAGPEGLTGARVEHGDPCASDDAGVLQARHPGQAAPAAPLEMDAHIGDQRGGGDIARAWLRQQRSPQDRRGEFDDVEAVGPQRNADHLERPRPAGLGDAQRRRWPARADQRRRAGGVDRPGVLGTGDRFLITGAVLGIAQRPQPFRDAGVALDRQVAALDRGDLQPGDAGLDTAHRHRQNAALRRLDDAERPGELDQRRQVAGGDIEREARAVDQRAAAVVGQAGG